MAEAMSPVRSAWPRSTTSRLTTLYVVAAAMVLKPTGDDPGILIAFAAILGLVLSVKRARS